MQMGFFPVVGLWDDPTADGEEEFLLDFFQKCPKIHGIQMVKSFSGRLFEEFS